MKLSQAIRLGAMLRPQAFGNLTTADNTHTCAIMAALEAGGYPGKRILTESTVSSNGRIMETLQPGHEVMTIPDHWMWIQAQPFACPVCCDLDAGVFIIGKHLNDLHRWTREEISEWVETVEPTVCECGCEMQPATNRERV